MSTGYSVDGMVMTVGPAQSEQRITDLWRDLKRADLAAAHRRMIAFCRDLRDTDLPLDRAGFIDRIEAMIEENYTGERTDEKRHEIVTVLGVLFALHDTDWDTSAALAASEPGDGEP